VVGDSMMDVAVTTLTPMNYGTDTPAAIDISPGGAGANTAVWLAALNNDVTLITSVGQDPFGVALVTQLNEHSVRPHISTHADAPTGTCVVLVDDTGERSMFPDPGANRLLHRSPWSLPPDVDHFHVSGYSLAHPNGAWILEVLARFTGTTSLDLASTTILGAHSVVADAAAMVNLVFGTVAEFACVPSDTPLPHRVQKDGRNGVRACVDGKIYTMAAPHVDVVATTGAGDAFAAGFLTSWLAHSHDIPSCLDLGTRCAAQALSRVAAWPARDKPGE
jgi:sugar/nucleoside kinase (ribokinase family)